VLADLLTGADSDLTRLPMTSHQPRVWEPEPLRSIGVNLMRRARSQRIEEAERTGTYPGPPLYARLLDR
jgi:hypothetical protein